MAAPAKRGPVAHVQSPRWVGCKGLDVVSDQVPSLVVTASAAGEPVTDVDIAAPTLVLSVESLPTTFCNLAVLVGVDGRPSTPSLAMSKAHLAP